MKRQNFWLLYFLLLAAFVASIILWAGRVDDKEALEMKNSPPATGQMASVTNEETNAKTAASNSTGLPLAVPDGFSVSTFASGLPGARVLVFDRSGNLLVSQPGKGTVTRLEISGGKVAKTEAAIKGLDGPHGLAFDPKDPDVLFIAEESKISKVNINSPGSPEKIADLPSGGGHSTRTIKFGSDGKLYVSIGSSCNVCNEEDNRRAKIFSLNPDGSDFQQFATGLRNTVFFTQSPFDGRFWGTDMGRDNLGDNVPPDEINIIEKGNYGWPNCYGANSHDANFDPKNAVSCSDKSASHIDIPAHSAPLGLAFVPANSNWPEEFKNDLIVSFHGSWNRSVPTGYKIVRVKLDERGNNTGIEDFITGFTENGKVLGRPVDAVFGPDGNAYVSDDFAGAVYKIESTK